MTTKRTKKAAEAAGTVVYCGPSIKGVARQYTAYNNGIPEGLKQAAEKNKILAALIVPLRTCRRPCANCARNPAAFIPCIRPYRAEPKGRDQLCLIITAFITRSRKPA